MKKIHFNLHRSNEPSTLGGVIKRYSIMLISLGVLFLISFTTLGIIYLFNRDDGVRLALFITSLTLLVVIVIFVVYVIFRYSRIFFGGLYQNTLENYNALLQEHKNLTKYENKYNYEEFNYLNDAISKIEDSFERITFEHAVLDYSKYNIEFANESLKLYSIASFEKKYKEIMNGSANNRHAFILISYPHDIKTLTTTEMSLFVITSKRIFHYDNMLYAVDLKSNEFFIYIPYFDSLSYLKEEVTKSIEKYCINRTVSTGYELINPRISAVIYPYSHYDDIFGDLRYAKRQGKLINFYLPDKPNLGNKLVHANARNIAFISRSLEKLSSNEFNDASFEDLDKRINDLFLGLINYYDFDMAGAVIYNGYLDRYENVYSFGNKNQKNEIVSKGFVQALDKHADKDGTVYFSSRRNVFQDIGRYIDRFGIETGFYYVFKDNKRVLGFVYMTKSKATNYDAYVRESFLVFSFYVSIYLDRIAKARAEFTRVNQLNDILKISGCCLYSINSHDYSILWYSPNLKQLLPRMKLGQKCYEAIFNRNKRCEKCPLRNGRKIIVNIRNSRYESSLALSQPGIAESSILLFPVKKDKEYVLRERFDHDLLVNSYFSFFEAIKDAFMVRERGYLLSINIDNVENLVKQLPSEKFNAYLRNLFNDIKVIETVPFELYLLANHSFALIVPNVTNNDIIDLSEKVYALSKKDYLEDGGKTCFNLSYFVLPYPSGYQNPDDYAKFVKNNSLSIKKYINKDFIYVYESKYARSASHQKYLIDVLNTSISTNTFKVKFQPVVDKLTRKILSIESLFRIADENRGGELNTFEVINAAVSENKISLITGLLMNYIEQTYKNYETTLFKKYNLYRMSINVDYSFFSDESFFNKFKEIRETYKLPDNFLTFEISEKEVARHYEEIGSVLSNIMSTNSPLVCDNYTGEFLSLDKIKGLGFDAVKIGFKISNRIDVDDSAKEGLISIVENCAKIGLGATAVGIENAQQYAIVREIKSPVNIQGYYFYRPLDEHELINALAKEHQ